MKILVSNDDGIRAKGINKLVAALSKEAEVYVIAPDSQRSGASHSITMHEKLWFVEDEVKGATKAYAFTGTPADCVKMGLQLLDRQGIAIDAVFSGINHGGNLGTDTLYSGTVGAAREGLVNGVFSVAMSVQSHEPKSFTYACELAQRVAKAFKEGIFERRQEYLLNINVPDIPKSKIKGLKLTKLGIRDYENWFNPVYCDDGRIQIYYGGKPISFDVINDVDLPADVLMAEQNYATITPLTYDLTAGYLPKEEVKTAFKEYEIL